MNASFAPYNKVELVACLHEIDRWLPVTVKPAAAKVLGPWKISTGNFSICSEAKYTYSYDFWFLDGIQRRELPMMTVGPQTVSPTTAPLRIPDPRFPIKNIETGPR